MGKNSEYIKKETIFGIVPLLKGDRQYGFWDSLLSTSGFAIATWCYTQGAYMASIITFEQLLISIFATSFLWIAIECIPVFFAVRYGIDLWIWLRAALGKNGVKILSILVVYANFGWYAVAADMFRSSLVQLFAGFGITIPEIITPWFGVVCVLLGTLIALGGPAVIKWTSRVMVTSLLVVGIIVVFLCFSIVPFTDVIAVKPDISSFPNGVEPFMISTEGMVAFAFSWSTQALVLPRLCKTERKGYWSTFASYGGVAPFFVFIGALMAIVMFCKTGLYEGDPTVMLATLCGPIVALLALFMVALANIGTQGVGSYVNDMVLKAAFPNVSYKVFVWISAVYVSILTLWGGVSENFGAFISLAAYIQGPIIGIIIVDYLVLRKRKISLKALFYQKGHDEFQFSGGFNVIGIASIIVGFICGMLVYNPMTGVVTSPIFYVTTGSGFTAITGGLVYFVLTFTPWGKRYSLNDRDDLEIA